jgi:hypothetical protein
MRERELYRFDLIYLKSGDCSIVAVESVPLGPILPVILLLDHVVEPFTLQIER